MTRFYIILQFLIFCSTPTIQRPVRLPSCQNKYICNKVRKRLGVFHNQPRQLTSQQRWESEQNNRGNFKYDQSHISRRKRRNTRRNSRQDLCSQRHGKAYLLKRKERNKTKHTDYRKQERKKRRKYKREQRRVKFNKRKSRKQRTQIDKLVQKRATKTALKTCRFKKERIKIKRQTGRKSLGQKTNKRCCTRKMKICLKTADKTRGQNKNWNSKTKCCRRRGWIRTRINQAKSIRGEGEVKRSSATYNVGSDELQYLERSFF